MFLASFDSPDFPTEAVSYFALQAVFSVLEVLLSLACIRLGARAGWLMLACSLATGIDSILERIHWTWPMVRDYLDYQKSPTAYFARAFGPREYESYPSFLGLWTMAVQLAFAAGLLWAVIQLGKTIVKRHADLSARAATPGSHV